MLLITKYLEYFQIPNSDEGWKAISDEFYRKWDFPNVIGCLDGKHIRMAAPENSGSYYYNYKGFHSIVLMALVDAKGNFIYIDVGSNGRISDGGVWRECTLSAKLEMNDLNIPPNACIPGTDFHLPLVILADDAFPLSRYIMKPYPMRNLDARKKTFNYRLSRARQVVESTFGLLVQRFRVLQIAIQLSPKKIESVVKASCVLHNWLNAVSYFHNSHAIQDDILHPYEQRPVNSCCRDAKSIRDRFADFFSNVN